MIIFYENGTLENRYYSEKPYGIRAFGSDTEEWYGIRSQLLAILYGWGL